MPPTQGDLMNMDQYLQQLRDRPLKRRAHHVLAGWWDALKDVAIILLLMLLGAGFIVFVTPLRLFLVPFYEAFGAYGMYVEGGRLLMRTWLKPVHYICTGSPASTGRKDWRTIRGKELLGRPDL